MRLKKSRINLINDFLDYNGSKQMDISICVESKSLLKDHARVFDTSELLG